MSHDDVTGVAPIYDELSAITKSASPYQVAQSVEKLALKMGFEWFHVLEYSDESRRDLVRNIHNAPPTLRGMHQNATQLRRDPVLTAAMNSAIPFHWDEGHYAGAPDLLAMRSAAGYRSGLAVRACDVRSQFCAVVFSTGRVRSESDDQTMTKLADLLLAAAHIQVTLARIDPIETPSLRPREVECLRWCIEGKTAKETARLIGISERTVNQHLARAMSQLGVNSKILAVRRAQSLGLLQPAALTPPSTSA